MIKNMKQYVIKSILKEVEIEPIEYTKQVFKTTLFMVGFFPLLFALVTLVLLFLFAFTHSFGTPSVLAQVLFFVLLIFTTIYFRIIRTIASFLNGFLGGTPKKVRVVKKHTTQ